MNATTSIVTPQQAAAHLAEQLGGQVGNWTTWLANDRRRAKLVPVIAGPGRPRYMLAMVDAFIAADRAKRFEEDKAPSRIAEVLRAVGIGEEGGSTTGRKLKCSVTAALDEATNEGFVQMVVSKPLLVFRLGLEQARQLSGELLDEAADAEKYQKTMRKEP